MLHGRPAPCCLQAFADIDVKVAALGLASLSEEELLAFCRLDTRPASRRSAAVDPQRTRDADERGDAWRVGHQQQAQEQRQALAYALGQMPGAYAAVTRILSELEARLAGFEPRVMLAYGAGPGTALWAAQEVSGRDVHHKGICMDAVTFVFRTSLLFFYIFANQSAPQHQPALAPHTHTLPHPAGLAAQPGPLLCHRALGCHGVPGPPPGCGPPLCTRAVTLCHLVPFPGCITAAGRAAAQQGAAAPQLRHSGGEPRAERRARRARARAAAAAAVGWVGCSSWGGRGEGLRAAGALHHRPAICGCRPALFASLRHHILGSDSPTTLLPPKCHLQR